MANTSAPLTLFAATKQARDGDVAFVRHVERV
jgi:hypothetical protein